MSYKGLSLEGKRALVLGGTGGIGTAISIGFAEAGADVVPVSRRPEAVAKTCEAIRALGRKTLDVPADVTRREEIQRVIDRMVAEMGRIDILVNCAGITKKVPSFDFTDEDFDRIMNTNVKATWFGCQMVGRVMLAQNYGRIINIASIVGFQAAHEVMPYCTSKGAVVMMTRCLAAEWAKYNIAVNALAPGVFVTDTNREMVHRPDRYASIMGHTPMKRFGEMEEIKGAAIFLASDSASYVTGETLCVDGGFLIQGIGG